MLVKIFEKEFSKFTENVQFVRSDWFNGIIWKKRI